MWVLEITAAQNLTGIPNVKLISGVFGDEHIGTEILLHFVDVRFFKIHFENLN